MGLAHDRLRRRMQIAPGNPSITLPAVAPDAPPPPGGGGGGSNTLDVLAVGDGSDGNTLDVLQVESGTDVLKVGNGS